MSYKLIFFSSCQFLNHRESTEKSVAILIINLTNTTSHMIFQNGGRRKKVKWELCEREVEMVNQFKYLGYWFLTGNRYGKHLQNMIGKAQTAVNIVWGVMKRAKINTLKERLKLMDSLVKAGALYGVEIWGWGRREGIEKLQEKFLKWFWW